MPLQLVIVLIAAAILLLVYLFVYDIVQTKHAVRRVYPILGRFRYIFEKIGPELRQYIVTSDLEERPFTRSQRAWVYQTSKGVNSATGFGTQHDVWKPGEYHFLPSPFATLFEEAPYDPYLPVIGPDRPRPFEVTSRVNVAPMSFGALSASAVRALSHGAKEAAIYVNTGEGGLSPYHLEGGCDLIFQIGPAKYGVRTPDGSLDLDRLREIGRIEQVRAVEVKLGQGAKPGKGGLLPGEKVTREISLIRGIPEGQSSISPNRFREFRTVPELMDFIALVQETVPVPVGVKLAVGDGALVEELAQFIATHGVGPDYISVDGAEGGTGAAPVSLADHMGLPLHDAIVTVDNALRRYGVRDRLTIIAAGRVITGAHAAYAIALGADLVNVARGFMLSMGCIQALKCHTNECPTGVATQSGWRQRGLVPAEKAPRVANYARAVQEDLMTVVRSVGLVSASQLRREHVEVIIEIGRKMRASELYPYPPEVMAIGTAAISTETIDTAVIEPAEAVSVN